MELISRKRKQVNTESEKGLDVNRKVWIINELTEDYCIGTVGQVLESGPRTKILSELIQHIVKEMDGDDVLDSDGIELTIQIR